MKDKYKDKKLIYMLNLSKQANNSIVVFNHMDRVKRIWYLSSMRAEKVQASLRICAVWPEPSLLAHTSSESRGHLQVENQIPGPSECLGMRS